MSNAIMSIRDIQRELGIGRELAERYAKESGALLPRVKNGPYRVRRVVFTEWFLKGENNE